MDAGGVVDDVDDDDAHGDSVADLCCEDTKDPTTCGTICENFLDHLFVLREDLDSGIMRDIRLNENRNKMFEFEIHNMNIM